MLNFALNKADAPKARFYVHRFRGKPQFSGQYYYDGTVLFVTAETSILWTLFGQKLQYCGHLKEKF